METRKRIKVTVFEVRWEYFLWETWRGHQEFYARQLGSKEEKSYE